LNTSDADIYIRDATGNVLAVYHYDRKTSQLRWSEQHLYGSARLGMYLPEKSVTSVSTESKQREVGYLGKQIFELSNHLGNILATITDKKLQVSLNTTSTAYFEADVQTVQDYYAFGMQMPGRKLSGGYPYGFGGQMKDDEIAGSENMYTAQFWEYDSRLGRRWNKDPVKKYWQSDYVCFSDNPILRTDPNGDDDYTIDKKGHFSLTKKTGAKNHTIFNADGSKSTSVGLDFFKTKFEGSSGSGKDKKENTIIVGRNLKDIEKAYKFFADNSDVEWQYNIYENKSKVGTLATSHTEGSIENYAELSYLILNKYSDIKLLYSSHSHPGTYDSKTGWPAYPSGYTYELKPDLANLGDRDNYKYYKDSYAGRIPSMFNIYIVGKPQIQVQYDDKVVIRTTELPTITIKPKAKKKQ
jgi:hypothetical protein